MVTMALKSIGYPFLILAFQSVPSRKLRLINLTVTDFLHPDFNCDALERPFSFGIIHF